MKEIFEYSEGATPLDPDEMEGLIPSHIVNRGQLVLQQCSFDEYRAIQSVQDKARVAGNGHSLAKTLNAVLDALGCSLRAIQKTVIHVVASFVKGTTIPFKTRLVANGFLNRCIHQNYVAGVLDELEQENIVSAQLCG